MDKQTDKKKKDLQKILCVLNKCKISEEGYDSTSKPFFMAGNTKDFTINFKTIDGIPSSLNRNIILIYNILGDPNKEIYIGEWTILSVDKAIKRYKALCNAGQKKVFNIAYRYMGLGHVEVISCDLETHLLFYHQDGGSNGLEREENFKNLVKNGSKNYNKFYFSKWFYNIKLGEPRLGEPRL